MERKLYDTYVDILMGELFPALGCTEPIAVAYAAAKARETLGCLPESMDVFCSGNIIKNVKGVTVPTSGGMKGIDVAAILGAVGGQADKKLEVLSGVTEEHRTRTRELVDRGVCHVHLAEGDENLYILCRVAAGEEWASVEIRTYHTNITRIEKNGEVLFSREGGPEQKAGEDPKDKLCMREIYAFANTVALSDVEELIERQIAMNSAIAQEGMANEWGVNVGAALLKYYGNDVKFRAAAYAASGSDARMNGCAMPVVINSGSGNQGLTVTMPVVVYAQELGVSREKLIRALVLANMVSLNQKRYIGSLSAYCGATSAAAGAACGIAYLHGESYEVICSTVINAIATIGGMVCDGAKSSCASKIRSAVDTALLGYFMAREGKTFSPGEGMVEGDIEKTIANFGRMGRVGMASTDVEILNIMIGN